MSFKLFTGNENSTINPELDPDTNFFESIFSLDTKYFIVSVNKTFITNQSKQIYFPAP